MSVPSILEVRGLAISFEGRRETTSVVHGIDLALAPGEVVGLVGESGSGKSVTSFAIAGLLESPPAVVRAEALRYRGIELLGLSSQERRALGGREIAMVYQDALSALNPVLTIGQQLDLVIRRHTAVTRAVARRRATEALNSVELPDAARRIDDFPHQFSGGQRQRILIALALCADPALLIADEPTTALDVTVQAQIVQLVSRLAREREMAVLWVTHDLGVVAGISDRVAVMRAGRIVEHAPTATLFRTPRHPYTRSLLEAIPTIAEPRRRLSEGVSRRWSEGHLDGGCPRGDCRLTVAATRGTGHDWACFRDSGEGAS